MEKLRLLPFFLITNDVKSKIDGRLDDVSSKAWFFLSHKFFINWQSRTNFFIVLSSFLKTVRKKIQHESFPLCCFLVIFCK